MNRKPTCIGRHPATENHLLASTPNPDELTEEPSRICEFDEKKRTDSGGSGRGRSAAQLNTLMRDRAGDEDEVE